MGSVIKVGELVKEPVDFALANNLFEHLTQTEVVLLLGASARSCPGGVAEYHSAEFPVCLSGIL